MEELNKMMKEILGQRMAVYTDCFRERCEDDISHNRFCFKDPRPEIIIYNNMKISCAKDEGYYERCWYSIELNDRTINICDDAEDCIMSIDVSKGYINILPVEGDESSIKIEFVEFRNEQIHYDQTDIDVYPLYGLSIQPMLFNNALIYNMEVTITMSPADEKVYKVKHLLPIMDTGIDGIVDSAINLYNTVLSKDFSNFFAMEKIVKVMGPEFGKEYTIIDHHYMEDSFLIQDEQGNKEQMAFIYYFTNMISSVESQENILFEGGEETKDENTTRPDNIEE